MGIHPKTLEFLVGLRNWNDKKFFELYRPLYDEIRMSFNEFTQNMINNISLFDERIIGTQAKNCTFRIYRDARFSHNKDPYKTNLGAFVAPGGKKSIFAGYYVHIEPGKCFFGGGIYYPTTQDSHKIREYIYTHFEEFKKIIQNKKFKRIFGKLSPYRDDRKILPKIFEQNHPSWEYIIMKDWLVEKKIDDNELFSKNFESNIVEYARTLYPLNNFLNNALD